MKSTLWILGLASSALAVGCRGSDASVTHASLANDARPSTAAVADDDEDDDGDEQEIALADLPAAIKNAALAAVPGIVLTEAEKEVENGRELYSVEGTLDGEEYCIEIATDGSLIGVEHEDDEDDD
jgi:uncharacterized membrane protein YkoI